MADMDLIPDDYRQRLDLKRVLRNFIVASVAVAICIALGKALLTYLIWRENVQVVRLEQQEQVLQNNKGKAEQYRQQKQITEQQIAALNELRGHDRVDAFLRAMDSAYAEGVWFDSLRFMRRSGTGSLDNVRTAVNAGIIVVPEGAEDQQSLDINHGVEIIGHSLSHSILAEFMRNLGAEESVADLRLIDTGTRNYTTTQVVDFKLNLKISEKAKEQS
jgi:cell division protein FtsB